MTPEQEREVLAPFLDRARAGGILVVGQVKAELEAALGRTIALSSVYNLLHRHGWCKLAPDKRGVIYLSGDIHVGCRFDVSVSTPAYAACSLTSSGIRALEDTKAVVGIFVDEDFEIAKGIRCTLRDIVTGYNFGVVEGLPMGRGAEITGTVAHAGNAFAAGIDVKDLVWAQLS